MKAAFRAGKVDGAQWNDASIGNYSIAGGFGTIASSTCCVAFGNGTTASGLYATALGGGTTASANYAVAMGCNTEATAVSSTAMGYGTLASGWRSTAIGAETTASGDYSIAAGSSTTASGEHSLAMGSNTVASGDYSTALGSYVITNGKSGTFMIGDRSTGTSILAAVNDRFYARFNNGYYLYSVAACNVGVRMLNGDNSWSSVSDSTLKEGFVDADDEALLRRFGTLRLGTWKFKGHAARHYGAMAQEWFAAFGRDGVGVIGEETSLASADVDGVLCIAVRALEQRTSTQREILSDMQRRLDEKDGEIALLRAQLTAQQQENDRRFDELVGAVRVLQQGRSTQRREMEVLVSEVQP
jgi:autotransporter adhesin